MTPLTQAALARRLGISKSAVTQAVQLGKLNTRPDGKIDPAGPQSQAYLSRFTLHRGKQRPEPVAQTPEAVEGQRRKLQAQFARIQAKMIRRKKLFIRSEPVHAVLDATRQTLIAGLRKMPTRVNFGAPALERELDRVAVGLMEAAKMAGKAILQNPDTPAGQDEDSLPICMPDDASITDLKTMLDYQAAHRHGLETAIESGILITRERAQQLTAQLHAGPFRACMNLPRRFVAELEAIRGTQGADAARTRLADLIESDLLPTIKERTK
ncbi:MAG: hypothetical protein AB7T74_03055 [Clostridia bacterium]